MTCAGMTGKLLMKKFFKIHDVGIKELLILGFVVLAVYTAWLHRQVAQNAYQKVSEKVEASIPWVASTVDTCGQECQKEIDKKIAQALATASAGKSTSASKVIEQTTKTSSVTLGSVFSTTNTDWTDVPGSVYIDPAGYGTSQSFSGEAWIKIGNGNGEGWVRLFDATNNIAVSGSELSTTSSTYTTIASGNISLWAGNNLYKAQVKSTTSQQVGFASGIVKVVYR